MKQYFKTRQEALIYLMENHLVGTVSICGIGDPKGNFYAEYKSEHTNKEVQDDKNF